MTIDRKIIWQEAKDYFNITLGLLLYTFGFTVFLLPYEIVTGGIAGIFCARSSITVMAIVA